MTNDDAMLAQWWNALSAEEQQEAFEAERTGQLTPNLQGSLMGAGMFGLTGETKEKPEKVPRALHDFLKMRH
ncbi:hypothetical protein ACOCJ5_02230 [Knoellia sp. CPCC 206450]|uniref:hypothetical protein n=1 Tax=Knoellia tibetensis TaxID=3404798 RepID=UPI003B4320BE